MPEATASQGLLLLIDGRAVVTKRSFPRFHSR